MKCVRCQQSEAIRNAWDICKKCLEELNSEICICGNVKRCDNYLCDLCNNRMSREKFYRCIKCGDPLSKNHELVFMSYGLCNKCKQPEQWEWEK